MSRKSKIEPIVKVKIVEQYLAGEIVLNQASKKLGVACQCIRKWISIYRCNGPAGLFNQLKNKSYSKTLKMSAVNDYLNGVGSLDDICLKYGIRSHTQLLKWIQVYNSGGILKTSINTMAYTSSRGHSCHSFTIGRILSVILLIVLSEISISYSSRM